MTEALPPLLLVGGGKMGGAMLAGWVKQGLAPSVVIDPADGAQALAGPNVTVVTGPNRLPPGFSPGCIILAVKPQMADEVLPELRPLMGDSLVLSIMAGRTLRSLEEALGTGRHIRAMPNTPASIGQGFTVAYAGPGVDQNQRGLANALLSAVGDVAWVEDEALIDPVTAISGGGPAYVFLLAELLEQAGTDHGLPPELARKLARATVAGSGALLGASEADTADLRRAVTSPKGTTEQALAVLMRADAWPASVRKAIAAATDRSRELAG